MLIGESGADLLILSHSGSWVGRFQVSSLAAASAANGDTVDVALFFAALASWVEGSWDVVDPVPPVERGSAALRNYPRLTELLADGRESGRIRLHACSASIHLLGLDPAVVQGTVDAIAGWAAFARMVRTAPSVVTF